MESEAEQPQTAEIEHVTESPFSTEEIESAKTAAAAALRTKLYEVANRTNAWDYLEHTTIWWDFANFATDAAINALTAGRTQSGSSENSDD